MAYILSRLCVAFLLTLLAGTRCVHAQPAPSVVLPDTGDAVATWPATTVLIEHAGQPILIAEALRRRHDFQSPTVPEGNFGQQATAVWLRIPVVQQSAVTRWILEVDYPPLNRIDVFQVQGNAVIRHVLMGNTVPSDRRPLQTRAHAVAIDIPPGTAQELYLRVQSNSAVVVPVRLHQANAFVARESGRLLVLGLIFGVALMLFVSSLVNGLSLRDSLFAYYALMIASVAVFFVSYTGLGHQFLWSVQDGALAKLSPWAVLLAMAGASLFAQDALELARTNPVLARLMQIVAAAGVLAILASAADVLDYEQTSMAASVLGPMPLVLASYESVSRALRGDGVATYLAIGWGSYTVGAISLAALIHGWAAADVWTVHLFQAASVVEMFAWMRVLAIRIEVLRKDAERSLAERGALESLAFTDALTGLPNRRGLALALEAALPGARPDRAVVVYMIDLDGFKTVNDRLGHNAGDALLAQVAQRVQHALRASDTIARQGGDEFVVVAEGVADEAAASALASKMIATAHEPFLISGSECRVGLTVGYVMAPQDADTPQELLSAADAAMYQGKRLGGGCAQRAKRRSRLLSE